MSVYTTTMIPSEDIITVVEAPDLTQINLTPVSDTNILLELTPVQLLSAVVSVNGLTGIVELDTDDITEGAVNLYYTDARFDARLATKTTTDLAEGGNLYYTDQRVDDYLQSGDVTNINFENSVNLSWNSNDGTLDLAYDGVTLQVGQEQHFYAKATETISNGDIIQFAGAQGDHLLIARADQTDPLFLPEFVIGVATQDFAKNEFGYVTSFGKVRDLDTTSYNEGDIIYLDPLTPGGWTTTEPTPPAHIIKVAAVTRSHITHGSIFVRPSHISDTDEIPEGSTNLYYTDARVDTLLATKGYATTAYVDTAKSDAISTANAYTLNQIGMLDIPATTTDLPEGDNLYYTDTRVGDYLTANGYATESYVDGVTPDSTDDLPEGITNLYYTQARVQTVIDNNTAGFATVTYVDAGDLQTYSDAVDTAQTYTDTAIANLIDSAPTTLDTLNELAAALGDDPNFASTVSTQLGLKLNTADFSSTADAWLGTKTTSNLTEGTNLYYTQSRFDTAFSGKTTSNLTEGTNLYYTDARANAAIDARVTGTFIEGLTYDTDGGAY